MNNGARILVGLGTVGSAVGGGLLLNNYLSIDDIQSKLKANDYSLLNTKDTTDNTFWTEILENYKKVAKDKEEYRFDDFLGEDKEGSTPSKGIDILKQKCQQTFEKKLSEDKDNKHYEKAKKWCTKPVKISEILAKEGYIALKIDDKDPNSDKETWLQKIKDHKNPKNKDAKINGLSLSKVADNSKETEDLKAIKEKCKAIGDSKNHSADLETSLANFKTWCSIKKETKNT